MLIRAKIGVKLINAIHRTLKEGVYFTLVEKKINSCKHQPKLTDPVGIQPRNGPFRVIYANPVKKEYSQHYIHATDIIGGEWVFYIFRWHFITVKYGKKVAKKALEDYYWEGEVRKAV